MSNQNNFLTWHFLQICLNGNQELTKPLRLDIQKKFSNKSQRVKEVDFHPTEPWLLSAEYSGNVYIWNYETNVNDEII